MCRADEILKKLHGSELTRKYFDKHGFDTPIIVDVIEDLGLKVPSADFSISDVETCVGELPSLVMSDSNKYSLFTLRSHRK